MDSQLNNFFEKYVIQIQKNVKSLFAQREFKKYKQKVKNLKIYLKNLIKKYKLKTHFKKLKKNIIKLQLKIKLRYKKKI